jgi:hypothetical protein
MNEPSTPEAFELFPRRALHLAHSRRQFLNLLRLELAIAEGRAVNGSAYKLPQLGLLADEQLAGVRPVIVAEAGITVGDGVIYGRLPDRAGVRPLFALHTMTALAFNGMNGRNTLGEIAADLALAAGWPPPRAFAFARGLFLHLVEQRVAMPG